MRSSSAMMLAVLVIAVVLCPTSVQSRKSSPVVTMTTDNFEELTKEGEWLIKFFSPNCGHCVRMAPAYIAAAREMQGRVGFAEVDATKDRGLSMRFGVKGFPTMFFVKDSQVYQFRGSRTKESLVAYAEEGWQSAPTIPYWQSPFGPVNRVKGAIVWTATTLMTWPTAQLVAMFGIPEAGAMFIVFMIGMVLMAFGLVVLAWFLEPARPKKKRN